MLGEFLTKILLPYLSIDANSRLYSSMTFFIDDSIKIIVLLFVMISAIGYLRTYLPSHKVKTWINKSPKGISNVIAALFGSVTPFCSCSSIPMFLSFTQAGIPLGTMFSFLITSPLVNEYLVVIMLSLFGWKITLAYVIGGIFIGAITGIILGKINLEKHLIRLSDKKEKKEITYDSLKKRILYGIDQAYSIVKKLWIWVLVGVGIGAIIHNYVPSSAIESIVDKGGIFSVPLAVILGVPIYGSCAAIVPIAVALFEKGVPLGTALAFMMAISALSFPEAVILRRAMNLKLILIFFAIVSLGIMIIGYMFNLIAPFLV